MTFPLKYSKIVNDIHHHPLVKNIAQAKYLARIWMVLNKAGCVTRALLLELLRKEVFFPDERIRFEHRLIEDLNILIKLSLVKSETTLVTIIYTACDPQANQETEPTKDISMKTESTGENTEFARPKPKAEHEVPKPKFTYLSASLSDGSKLILSLGLVRFLAADSEKAYAELCVYELTHAQSTGDNDELRLDMQNAEYFPMDCEDRAFAAFQKRLMSQTPEQPSSVIRFTYRDLVEADAKYYRR